MLSGFRRRESVVDKALAADYVASHDESFPRGQTEAASERFGGGGRRASSTRLDVLAQGKALSQPRPDCLHRRRPGAGVRWFQWIHAAARHDEAACRYPVV